MGSPWSQCSAGKPARLDHARSKYWRYDCAKPCETRDLRVDLYFCCLCHGFKFVCDRVKASATSSNKLCLSAKTFQRFSSVNVLWARSGRRCLACLKTLQVSLSIFPSLIRFPFSDSTHLWSTSTYAHYPCRFKRRSECFAWCAVRLLLSATRSRYAVLAQCPPWLKFRLLPILAQLPGVYVAHYSQFAQS